MCGIAGRCNFKTRRPVDPALVSRMCDLVAHRGPDGSGVLCRRFAGLGHRRLAIIDLSPAGAQPMASDDERLWITFNGEIYNYLELRQALEARGHRFRSNSDTEVILHLYQEYGEGCLEHLRGMFAFAIWDDATGQFFAARDRAGKKPFWYWVDDDGLAFASEPKAFLADPGFTPRPNLPGIWDYLSYQYVPAPASGFKDVFKLPPAHFLKVHDSHLTVTRYWKLSYAAKRSWTEDEAAEALLAELETATRLRLISDVPLGAFLSGGIDSAVVVALMARAGASPLRTYSIGFTERDYNELPFARPIAERYGTDHHEFVVRPDAVEILPSLVWHYNEPFADSSAIPTYYLAQETRRHVTVALNGDGGDEDFAGYERYRGNSVAEALERVPRGVRQMAARASALIPARRHRSPLARARRLLETAAEPRERRYARWMMHFHPALKAELCTPDFANAMSSDSTEYLLAAYAASDARNFTDATLDVDVNTYLPNDLLVKVDIATMAHALEGRSPFLDHKVMELAASLPVSLKLRGMTKKYLLKRVARDLVPAETVTRPKMGFGVPLEDWFRRELRDLAHDVLLSKTAEERGYFRTARIRQMLDDHIAGRGHWHLTLWNLLMLELWHRMFIDERPSLREPPAPLAAPARQTGAKAVGASSSI